MGAEDQHLPQPPAIRPAAPGPELVPERTRTAGIREADARGGLGDPGNRMKPKMTWSRRVEKIILAFFCLQVGLFLLFFPWTSAWERNYIFEITGSLRPFFLSPYFRGAISGLGVLNLYLVVAESVEFLGSFLEEPAHTTE